jgi:hypothetical protein
VGSRVLSVYRYNRTLGSVPFGKATLNGRKLGYKGSLLGLEITNLLLEVPKDKGIAGDIINIQAVQDNSMSDIKSLVPVPVS